MIKQRKREEGRKKIARRGRKGREREIDMEGGKISG